MRALPRQVTELIVWLIPGLALMPGILWLVYEYLQVGVGGQQDAGLLVFYLDFYRGRTGVSSWLWVLVPYLLFLPFRPHSETRRPRGCTPLGLAAFKGDIARIRALLRKGANINRRDRSGRTPLHLAAFSEGVDVVRLLLEAGADVDITDRRFGFRPLHFSARQGDADVSELLVRYGADVDGRSLRGETALHLAVMNAHPAVVTMLLKYLARVDIHDSNNKTPLQYAEADGKSEIVDLIQNHVSDTWAYLQLVNS